MKKLLFVLLAASLGFAACQIEILYPNASNTSDKVLTAKIEQKEATKTVLDENSNIRWSKDDQIVAFMKTSYGHKYQIQPSFVGKTYANFSKISSVSGDDLSAGMKWDHNVAYYPYAEEIECVKSDVNYTLDVVIPAEQTYAGNSFGNGYFPMVAVSEDNDITFKNICGGMKLQLKGTQKVTSITVQGKNNEVLSGTATVTAYTDGETKPSITMTGTDAASKSVTLDCGAGVQLSESTVTEFIIALPPVDFTEGFAVTVTDSHGNNQIVETDEENSVLRSSLLIMPPVKLEDSAEQSNVKFSLLIAPDTGTKAGSYSEHVDIVYYEVWDSDWSRKIYPKDDNELAKEVVVGGKATVNLSLASTNTYNIIFWAQNEECGAYDVKDLRRVKIDYSAMSASEDSEEFESFYAVKNFTVYGSVEETIHLKRPLALIYFGEQESDVESPSITGISLTVSNLATVFNTLEGCGEVATEKQVTFVADAQNLSPNGLNGKKYTMNYVFASGTSSQVKAEACFEIDGREEPLVRTLENVAIGKNKRTDILVKWRDFGPECSTTLRSNDDTFMDDVIDTK